MIFESLIPIAEILVKNDRIRAEKGDIDALANSIKEFGLIAPIVLAPDGANCILVAGERRLTALACLGIKDLIYGTHYIWRSDLEGDPLRQKACELEENIRRKALTWQEEVTAKKQLLELMQSIHGEQEMGRGAPGFGIRKLAAMIGESPTQTSNDLALAKALAAVPSIGSADNKTSAMRQISTASKVITLLKAAAARATQKNPEQKNTNKITEPAPFWELFCGDFKDNAMRVPDASIDLVYCDLPYGVDLSKMSKHDALLEYEDRRANLLDQLCKICEESYRVLKPDSFAVFWFGFNYYHELIRALTSFDFKPNPVPFIWIKSSRSTEDPLRRYANGYEQAIVAAKGSPQFIRPGLVNTHTEPSVAPNDRLQIAQQPVNLVKRLILDMTVKFATVCDFTAGSGTTGVAALELGRNAILFEREPTACEIIKARLESIK